MKTKELIVRAAGKRGKTKEELAARTGVGYSTAAKHVNDLVFAGRLTVVGKTAGGADIFAQAGDTTLATRTK